MARRRRKVIIGETRPAGRGGDGEEYGVTSVKTVGGDRAYRRTPCETCPWRKDAPVGRFPAQAYRESAHTAYDGSFHTFACHESGAEAPATCAGFLLANADNNMAVRMAMVTGKLDPTKLDARGVELYGSYREMAEANGVDPDDPVLRECRSNTDGRE